MGVCHAAIDSRGCAQQYESRKVIFSMGYYDVPNRLNVPGEDLPKVIHYYKEAHPYYNHDVLVVGAKNSAAIAALELWWTGARVTLVHRGEGIHENVKYWIKPNIENRIKNGEIPAYFNSRWRRFGEDSVRLKTPKGKYAEERFRFCDDRLSAGYRVSGRARDSLRSRNRGGLTRIRRRWKAIVRGCIWQECWWRACTPTRFSSRTDAFTAKK